MFGAQTKERPKLRMSSAICAPGRAVYPAPYTDGREEGSREGHACGKDLSEEEVDLLSARNINQTAARSVESRPVIFKKPSTDQAAGLRVTQEHVGRSGGQHAKGSVSHLQQMSDSEMTSEDGSDDLQSLQNDCNAHSSKGDDNTNRYATFAKEKHKNRGEEETDPLVKIAKVLLATPNSAYQSRDVQFYLKFLRNLRNQFAVASIFALLIALPVNLSAPLDTRGADLTWIARSSVEALGSEDWRMFILLFVVSIQAVVGYYFIYLFWSSITKAVEEDDIERNQIKAEYFTVKVRGIRRNIADASTIVANHFAALFPNDFLSSRLILDYQDHLRVLRRLQETARAIQAAVLRPNRLSVSPAPDCGQQDPCDKAVNELVLRSPVAADARGSDSSHPNSDKRQFIDDSGSELRLKSTKRPPREAHGSTETHIPDEVKLPECPARSNLSPLLTHPSRSAELLNMYTAQQASEIVADSFNKTGHLDYSYSRPALYGNDVKAKDSHVFVPSASRSLASSICRVKNERRDEVDNLQLRYTLTSEALESLAKVTPTDVSYRTNAVNFHHLYTSEIFVTGSKPLFCKIHVRYLSRFGRGYAEI